MLKNCIVCGTEVEIKGNRKTCSEKCYLQHRCINNKTKYKTQRAIYQKKWWKDKGISYFTNWRQMNRKKINKKQQIKRYGKTFKSAKEEAKRLGFRSMFEVQTAEYLKDKKVKVLYEPDTLYYIPSTPTKRRYTPDFKVGKDRYIECKGYMKADSRKKYLDVKKQYPELEIMFVFQAAKNKIYKGSNTTYSDWCDTNGFKWCEFPNIPKEWLTNG